MGLAITLEAGRGSGERLSHALRPLAAFGFLHGTHEWLEMFMIMEHIPTGGAFSILSQSIRIGLLALSFLSLAAFGTSLLSPNARIRRLALTVPLGMAAIWGFVLLSLRGRYPMDSELWDVADVWTRYILAIPSALLASGGLVVQQRVFRQAGLAQFGRDSLWAAIAFAWYGLVGQMFTRASYLPLSRVINEDLFIRLFGFPIQLLRAGAAILAAVFVIRFLRSSEVETQRRIVELQQARLKDAQRRETLRGELLRRVVAAQEKERKRVGRELHDETGQALTAIGLGLRAAVSSMQTDVKKTEKNLRKLEDLVSHSLTELQRLIADLRPTHLDDLGLAAALRWYAGEVEDRVPIKVAVEVEGNHMDLPPGVKTGLFRVAQEALTNVVKHADAKMAKITVKFGEESVEIEISDDGCGFNSQIMAMDSSRPSWGLAGMEERATLLNGEFEILSEPGRGTHVLVRVPYFDEIGRHDDDSTDTG